MEVKTYEWVMSEWYWIMPNKVLFDKNLSDKQKLLYCLISSLCAEKGYCWATNDYLAEKIWYNKRNVYRLLQWLIDEWYIETVVNKEMWNQRRIFLNSIHTKVEAIHKNVETPIHKIVDHNNIIYNNINEIPKNSGTEKFSLNSKNETGESDVCARVATYEDIQEVITDDSYRVANNKLLKCIIKMCDLWYNVDKKEKPIRELVDWIKEKAEIYNIKNPDWTIAQWTMLQLFDQWCEYWKAKGKVTNHKNSVMRFMINYNKPYKKK